MLERHLSRLNIFALLAVATLLAALNREHALIYGLFAIIAAATVVGFFIPWWQLRAIDTRVEVPQNDLFEGADASIEITVRNRGWLPRRYLRLCIEFDAGRRAHETTEVLIVRLGPRSSSVHRGVMRFPLRGAYVATRARLESTYPLGLITSHRDVAVKARLLVLPRVFPVHRLNLGGAGSWPGISRENEQPGDIGSFVGLREYVPGDAPRTVHWPTSARTGDLHVILFERVMRPALTVLLDTRAAPQAGEGTEHTFEYAVRIAASIVEWADRHAMPLQLLILKAEPIALDLQPGEGSHRLLRALAEVEADSTESLPELLALVQSRLPAASHRVVISTVAEGASQDATGMASLAGGIAPVTAILVRRQGFLNQSSVAAEKRDVERQLLAFGLEVIPIERGGALHKVFA